MADNPAMYTTDLTLLNKQATGMPLSARPEKILQFGTGVLLRGLPDFYVQEANDSGHYNGSIVIIKSTGSADDSFASQDNLYHIITRGISEGKEVDQVQICDSISRVLHVSNHWEEILEVAASPALELIFSNTTEKGLIYQEENILNTVPHSFPAKLLCVLHHRYTKLGPQESGLVVIPTELIENNGDLLKSFVVQLAVFHRLDSDFMYWLHTENSFCNSLVDRIVPGLPGPEIKQEIENNIGFRDDLMVVTEPYNLWAIEGKKSLSAKIGFIQNGMGVSLYEDILVPKELKFRFLNGTHILSCGVALLTGSQYVREISENADLQVFVRQLMDEIADGFPIQLEESTKNSYAEQTFERFLNPHMDHRWAAITLNFTMKMKVRTLPVLHKYIELKQQIPQAISRGFAAYLMLNLPNHIAPDGTFQAKYGEFIFDIEDEHASSNYELYKDWGMDQTVQKWLSNQMIWGENLDSIPHFTTTVLEELTYLVQNINSRDHHE